MVLRAGYMSDRKFERRAAVISLDEIDRAILAELQADARLRVSQLSRRVGLSAPAMAERVRRLEESAVLSYRAEVDPHALGYPICALVRISPNSTDLHRV